MKDVDSLLKRQALVDKSFEKARESLRLMEVSAEKVRRRGLRMRSLQSGMEEEEEEGEDSTTREGEGEEEGGRERKGEEGTVEVVAAQRRERGNAEAKQKKEAAGSDGTAAA